jgi:hypothetical protein
MLPHPWPRTTKEEEIGRKRRGRGRNPRKDDSYDRGMQPEE